MNKKYLMFGLMGLFAVALVSAGLIQYYGQVEQDITIESPITITDFHTSEISGMLQSPQLGELVIITNKVDFDVDVNVDSISNPDDITTSYVGELRLSKKDVVFGTTNWDEITGTDVIVEYTVVADKLLAEVVSGAESGYVLVYYADNTDRFNNVAKAIAINDVDASLPYEGDANADEYNYCNSDGYTTCYGAKIWYVPNDAIPNGVVDWSMADQFYFETDLIHYFKTVNGNTVIPAGVTMEFTPMYEFGAIEGTYTVTTSVTPVA